MGEWQKDEAASEVPSPFTALVQAADILEDIEQRELTRECIQSLEKEIRANLFRHLEPYSFSGYIDGGPFDSVL